MEFGKFIKEINGQEIKQKAVQTKTQTASGMRLNIKRGRPIIINFSDLLKQLTFLKKEDEEGRVDVMIKNRSDVMRLFKVIRKAFGLYNEPSAPTEEEKTITLNDFEKLFEEEMPEEPEKGEFAQVKVMGNKMRLRILKNRIGHKIKYRDVLASINNEFGSKKGVSIKEVEKLIRFFANIMNIGGTPYYEKEGV